MSAVTHLVSRKSVSVSTGGVVAFACATLIAVTTLVATVAQTASALPSGFESFSFQTLDEAKAPFTQAGGHPSELITTILLDKQEVNRHMGPMGTVKDLITELPAGLIGDPAATPRCELRRAEENRCSGASQVGLLYVDYSGRETRAKPVFNVVPPKGVAARFVAQVNASADAFIDAHLRTGGDYGVSAGANQVTELAQAYGVTLVLWGVPGEASHNKERSCPGTGLGYVTPCSETDGTMPFLSEPTSCSGQELAVGALADFYQAPGEFAEASTSMPAVSGCKEIEFDPELKVIPESTNSDSSAGLRVDLKVPQNGDPEGLAIANLKDATVTLPAGLTVNPSEASGIVGCPLLTGKEPHEGEVGIDLENSGPANCPDASKIGKVELETPLIEHILPGAVYLAQQGNAGPAHGSNPFGSLLAMYIVIDDPETGVIVKLAGEVHLDLASGQLSATFNENPQLPFSDMKLDFFGGERAPLATPMTCGAYTTTSVLEPWSHEAPGEVGTPDAKPSSEFQITSAPGGGACSAPGFAPGLVAGTTNNHAGSYSPFTTLLTRKDGEQRFKSVAVTLPKGVSGMISKVPRCDEADADAGTCPAATQIGHVVVQAGVGNEPVTLPEAGKQEDPVYLTEPYEGAPFGLSIVVHPEAGPFDLADGAGTAAERPIIVRARLEVDPHTAQVSVVTDASGPYAMPTILQGIPADVKSVYVVVDRPNFTFNPTSCEPMATTGTIGSADGASAAVSSRFQAASCEGLEFAPKFRASTIAKSSRKDGAELQVKVSYPKQGEANIGKAKVSLPKALPSRLSTLNLACTADQFAANPAGCPAASDVGTATAVTPVLASPLRGPAYFVSHGGAKFPELIMVLQGEGITIDLAGETLIKHGVTTTTLNAVPDEPVSSFKLTLPEGEYSALAAPGGKLCQRKLVMPTILTGQNGKMLEQKTHIAVRGCSKHMSIVSHKVKRRRLTLRVYAPSGGRLKASGRGLSSKTKRARGRGALTFRLHEKLAGRLRTSVHVSFTPKHGKSRKRQAESVRVRFRR